jgi:hypothetical protein
LHLKKGRFPSSNFWIEKPPSDGEGCLIAVHLHPLHHFAREPKRGIVITDTFKEEDVIFLIQEAPAGK